MRKRRTLLQTSLRTYRMLGHLLLDDAIADDEIRTTFLDEVTGEEVARQMEEEVDDDLHFIKHFLTPAQQEEREAESVCLILATIMAHGQNITPVSNIQAKQDTPSGRQPPGVS